jgi:hypothetical protein
MHSVARSRWSSGYRKTLLALSSVTLVALPRASARAQAKATTNDARWAAIRHVFGQGETEDGYFRINLPRSDLHVSIGGDTLSPDFEFKSYVGFVPTGADAVLAMGELVLLQSEVPTVLAEARRQGIQVTALHNHLRDESPRIMYMHVMAEGSPEHVAAGLRAAFAKSATPLTPPHDEPAAANWTAIDAILGPHAEASGTVAEYGFARRESLRVHGVRVKSSGLLETASEVVFERLANGRIANTGELYLLASEVEPVMDALEQHGLHVTALHTHMLDDGPPHYWMHWYAVGDGPTLARGVAAALARTAGSRRSAAEH